MTDFEKLFDIRCFNVKFSPNLGDGLLSECLEHALVSQGAAAKTHSVDLAARQVYGDVMAGRSTIMTVLDALPKPARGAVVRLPLAVQAARKWRPHYRAGLAGADAVAIGGGNLISDIDLNFPTKLTLAIEESERRNLPVAIYACGMATGWSRTGLRMCRKAFSSPNLKAVFLRDQDSVDRWNEIMAPQTGKTAQVVRDPGLMASDLYPAMPRGPRARPVAGLGIISPIAIRYHSDHAPHVDHLSRWYLDVARGLIAAGMQVHVFTNGSPEDKAYAASLHDALRALGSDDDIRFVTQTDPKGLCANIAEFDVMIAYRMHAVIIAYSYGIPAIALAWDRKLHAFMASVDREEWFFDVTALSPQDCVTLAQQAVSEGVSEDTRQAVLADARADVAKLMTALTSETAI